MKKFYLPILLFSLFLVVAISGCKMNAEETYTVWTDSCTYSEFQETFNTTLDDGMYIKTDINSTNWNKMASSIPNEGKHVWTKEKIRDWLIGRGFGNSEATKESAWLSTVDHGFLASRTGNVVYLILK